MNGIRVSRRVFRTPETPGWRGLVARLDEPLKARSLESAYRRSLPDVINVHCVSNAARFEARAARKLGIPLVITLHGELTMDATGLFARSQLMQATLRELLTSADAITACSAATLREAEGWLGEPLGDRARVVYNGVDVAEFRDAVPAAHPRPYVFAIGRHVRQKGFDLLVSAFAELRRFADHDVDLVIAGDGVESGALRQQVERAGLRGRVHLVGRTDRAATASWFKGAEAFVLPSRHEPFGIVNLEAMAAGVPVVATAVGGVTEFVKDEVTGIVVEPESVAALAAAIDRVLQDSALKRRLVHGGREEVVAFGWPRIASQYLETYRDAIAHRAHPGPPVGENTRADARRSHV